MTILVTVFLVLVNIFNSITSNIPKADGLTAIEMFMIVNIIFVFCALIGEQRDRYKTVTFLRIRCHPLLAKDQDGRSAAHTEGENAINSGGSGAFSFHSPDFMNPLQSAFMRMDVNGDGTLTKREMLAAEEFTPEEAKLLLVFIRKSSTFPKLTRCAETLTFTIFL